MRNLKLPKPIKPLINSIIRRCQFISLFTWRLFLFFLISTLLFALIYDLISQERHFYHSTSQYETQFFTDDVNSIVKDFNDEIDQNLKSSPHKLGDWVLDDKDKVSSAEVSNYLSTGQIVFLVDTTLSLIASDQSHLSLNLSGTLTLTPNEAFAQADYFIFPVTITQTAKISNIPSIIELLPIQKISSSSTEQTRYGLKISRNLKNKIDAFVDQMHGFPNKSNGQLLRMLYLSTGIATATTYGDVVPVSTVARTLVMIQSMVSLSLIGLFILSLGRDYIQFFKLNEAIKIRRVFIYSSAPANVTVVQSETES